MLLSSSERVSCRICDASDLRRFLRFDGYPLSDNFLDASDLDGAGGRECLMQYEAHFCPECSTVQNLTDFDWSAYYADYDYAVSASGFARGFMAQVVASVEREFGLGSGDSAIEIGSSDGAQLKAFKDRGFSVFGFEPSTGLAKRAEQGGVPTSTSLFGSEALTEIPAAMLPVQVIASFYTFDHLSDPQRALEAMAEVLDRERGVVLIEVHDLEQILVRREACLFCHEHTVYPSRRSLARMFERAGLRLVHDQLVPENERRGNSLFVAAVHADNPHACKLTAESEFARTLDDWATYESFAREVETAHMELAATVRAHCAAGRRVGGFGASARSISTLALAGLDHNQVEVLFDNNPSVQGRFLPRSHVPVVAPARVLDYNLDEIIVFAYGYFDEIARELEPFTARGGRLTSLLELLQ